MKNCLFLLFLSSLASNLVFGLPNPDGKSADMSQPVQVFIIMGQSNTLEMGRVKGDKDGTLKGDYGHQGHRKTKSINMHHNDEEANVAKAYKKLKKEHAAMMKHKRKKY